MIPLFIIILVVKGLGLFYHRYNINGFTMYVILFYVGIISK